MASADSAQSERRRTRSEICSDGESYKACGDIERPAREELRGLRSEPISAGSRRRRVVPASTMVSSSILRSSLSHSRPISKHRRKSELVHRSETGVKQHTRRTSISKDDDSSHYISVPRRPKVRSSTIKTVERRQEDDSSDTNEDEPMSIVSEESESEAKPKPRERKEKITIMKTERPRSSRRNSVRDAANDEKTSKDDINASTRSLHRSNTKSSHRTRSQSVQGVRESEPVRKRRHSLSQSRLPTKSPHEPSMTNSKATSRHPSFLGIMLPPIIKEEKPPKPPRL